MMHRRKTEINDSESGVSTTVGTIMAMLVFLSILSLITQQYVPVWMEDKEAYHMDEVKGQFAELKGSIDTLIVTDQKNYPRYSSINLGTQGVPLFAGASPGRLELDPTWGGNDRGLNVEFGSTDISPSTGNISYRAFNREFESQTVVYEHGAIILVQNDGAVMRAEPHISIEKEGGGLQISMTMIDLIGSDEGVTGTSRVGITTELVSSFENTYTSPGPVHLNLTTAYPQVWNDYFINSTALQDSDVNVNGNKVVISPINNVDQLLLTKAKIEIELTI